MNMEEDEKPKDVDLLLKNTVIAFVVFVFVFLFIKLMFF